MAGPTPAQVEHCGTAVMMLDHAGPSVEGDAPQRQLDADRFRRPRLRATVTPR